MEDMEVMEITDDMEIDAPEREEEEVEPTSEVEENDLGEDKEDEFDPDNLFDEEDGKEQINYQFGSYDLSKYADDLNFEDEEFITELQDFTNRYEQAGFTQEQMEFILDDRLKEAREDDEAKSKKPTNKEIKERLVKSLTKEEIRNYKPTAQFVNNLVKGTEFEGKAKDILQNPALVKLFHMAYKQSLGKTGNLKSINKRQESQLKTLSLDEASDRLIDAINEGKADDNLIKQLKNSVKEKDAFNELLEALGR